MYRELLANAVKENDEKEIKIDCKKVECVVVGKRKMRPNNSRCQASTDI